MPLRLRVLGLVRLHLCMSPPDIMRFVGDHVTYQRIAQILAKLEQDGLIKQVWRAGNRRYYGPTPRSAREVGMDTRRFEGYPGMGAIHEYVSTMIACKITGYRLLRPSEFARYYPTLAQCPGVGDERMLVNLEPEIPVLYHLVFGHRGNAYRVARTIRSQWKQRRQWQPAENVFPFGDMIVHPLNTFRILVLVGFASKQDAVTKALLGKAEFTPEFVVAPELIGLFPAKEKE